MYKAIQGATGVEIVILETEWVGQVDVLHAWSQADELLCQECHQPVRARTGQQRVWHFAHKSRQDCLLHSESPALLQARALLYYWLVGKFGRDRVTVEKQLSDRLPRPVDVWIASLDGTNNFAYWLLEAGLKAERRERLRESLGRPGMMAHWLFLDTMQRPVEEEPGAVHLSPTEREMMQATDYDKSVVASGRSLHYLDAIAGQLFTYRGLHLIHAPQVYWGRLFQHPLDEVLISGKTGELIHPGEHERLRAYRDEQKKREHVLQAAQSRTPARSRPLSPIVPEPPGNQIT